jgi:hypothetical protein
MNKKALTQLVKIILWIIFFLAASYGVYSLVKAITGG